jgi:Big-like domain-containing protein
MVSFGTRLVISLAALTSFGCGGGDLTIPGNTGGSGGTPAGSRAARIEPVEGDTQMAAAGAEVTVRPAVKVTDAQGQPVAGFEVTFVVTAGGGTLLDPSRTTGSDGIARVGGWTLGSPGMNTLEARASSLEGSPVVFRATALSPADVDHFVFVAQPVGVKANERQILQVAMVDTAGNVVPLSGIEIYLGLFHITRNGQEAATNDRLLGDRFARTENGVATFSLGVNKVGSYRFRALSDDLPEVGPHGPEPFLFSRPFNVY